MSKEHARHLRKNLTDAETALWKRLRYGQLGGFRFRRQVPIGRYIADFACHDPKLVVELDGGQHSEQVEYDAERTKKLEADGFRVLRYWNHVALNETDAVVAEIWRTICQMKGLNE